MGMFDDVPMEGQAAGARVPRPPQPMADEMEQPTSGQPAADPALTARPNSDYAIRLADAGQEVPRDSTASPLPAPMGPFQGPRAKAGMFDDVAPASASAKGMFDDVPMEGEAAPGFADRLAKDYKQRQANIAAIPSTDAAPSQALQIAGQGMGVLKDVGNEAIGSAMGLLPQSAQESIAKGGFATPGGPIQRAANFVGPKAQAAYDRALPPGTEARRNTDALGTGASALWTDLPLIEGSIGAAKGAAAIPKVKEFMADTSTGGTPGAVAGMVPDFLKPKSAESIAAQRAAQTVALRASGSAAYKASSAEGIGLSDQNAQRLNGELEDLKPTSDLEKRTWASSAAAKHAQDIQDSLKTENPTMDGMIAKRAQINGLMNDTRNADEARKLGLVKDAMDKAMIGPATSTWQKANHLWAQQATVQDTDDMVAKALAKQQPANTLDTLLNNYLNGRDSRHLSDDEWQALKDVTHNGPIDKLKKVGASGLLKYATTAMGSAGGVPGEVFGYLAGHAISEGLKNANMVAKLQKLDKFREMVLARQLPEPPP